MEPDHPNSRGLHILADTLRDYHRARLRAQVVVDLLHDRIESCANRATLERWIAHAATAISLAEGFGLAGNAA